MIDPAAGCGEMASVVYLDAEDLLILIDDLQVGPVRDIGLLDAAAHRPGSVLYGVEAYPELDLKAAVLLDSLVRNHPLVDGNKRLGWLAVVVFYAINGVDLDAPDDPAYDLVIGVAQGERDPGDVAEVLQGWRENRGGAAEHGKTIRSTGLPRDGGSPLTGPGDRPG